MIMYDDESSPDKAVTYYERAITIDKVDLVSGGYPGTANVALMPLLEKYGKVFVGMGGHLKSFGQGYRWMKTLELAVQGSGTLDPKRIRDYLRSQKFDLPYGLGIKFDSRGLPPPYAFTVVTTGGKNVLV